MEATNSRSSGAPPRMREGRRQRSGIAVILAMAVCLATPAAHVSAQVLPPLSSDEAPVQELKLGWSWVGQSSLGFQFAHRDANPVRLRWTGSVPLTDEREEFAPEAGFGLGVGTMRAAGAAAWLGGHWTSFPYADEKRGLLGLGGGASYSIAVPAHAAAHSPAVGVLASYRHLVFDSSGAMADPSDAVRITAAAYAEVGEWSIHAGGAFATETHADALERGDSAGPAFEVGVSYALRWNR